MRVKLNFRWHLTSLTVASVAIAVLSCCSTDEQVLKEGHSKNKNMISFSDFQRETKVSDLKSVFRFTRLDPTLRDAAPEEFIVDTLAILTAIKEGKTTYSFRVYPMTFTPKDKEVFNLVYRKENDIWEKSIVSYVTKLVENTKLCEDIKAIYDSKFATNSMIIDFAALNGLCYGDMYYVQCDGSCSGECDGFGCPTGQCVRHRVVTVACPYSFQTADGNGGGGGGGGAGGGGGGGGEDGDGGESDDTPTFPNTLNNPEYEFNPNTEDAEDHGFSFYDTLTQARAEEFKDSLTEGQQEWANGHFSQYNPICNLYLQHYGDYYYYALAVAMIANVMEGGTADIAKQIISDPTFVGTQIECIHKKMESNPSSWSLYKDLLANFSAATGRNLTLATAPLASGNWGETTHGANPQNYTVTINSNIIEPGSNLMKMVVLCHELMHAYMFSTLEAAGLITFDPATGDALFNASGTLPLYSTVNLAGLTMNDRWVIFMYGLNASGNLTNNWSHELFNSNVFSAMTFREKLQNYIFNTHDWAHENPAFIADAQNVFGANWKMEVSKAVSYIGLDSGTSSISDYTTYINSYSTTPAKLIFISDIRNKIANANNVCP